MKRRSLLLILSLLPVYSWASSSAERRQTLCQSVDDPELLAQINNLLSVPDSARLIGERYLRANPHEADREHLIRTLIPKSLLHGNAAREYAIQQLKQGIRQNICDDFRMEQTCELDGWILSSTELKLCALIALS